MSIGLQSQIPWGFSCRLPYPQVGKSVEVPRTFLTMGRFIWCFCSAVCGLYAQWFYGVVSGDLLQEGLCHLLCDPGLLLPEPLPLQQATADPCLHRRLSNTQRPSGSVTVGSPGPGAQKKTHPPSVSGVCGV